MYLATNKTQPQAFLKHTLPNVKTATDNQELSGSAILADWSLLQS